MKKIDLAYIAGIFDGEGYISFVRRYRRVTLEGKRQSTDIPTTYYLRCGVTNTVKWLPEWLKFVFGGRVYQQYKANPHQKDCYVWSTVSNQALAFLEIIMPYLKLKRAEAELALRIRNHRKANSQFPITAEEAAIRQAEYILMKKLKEIRR